MRTKTLMTLLVVGLIGLCLPQPGEAHAEENHLYKVNATSLNVRSGPDRESPVVGSLTQGELVSVKQEAHGWMQVETERLSGWSAGYYLLKAEGGDGAAAAVADTGASTAQAGEPRTAPQAEPASGSVLADSLRIRSGPGLDQEVIGAVYQGSLLTVLGSRDGWLNVQTADAQAGWVAEQYVAIGAAAGQTAQSVQTAASLPAEQSRGLQGKVIVIDPGHGGKDPGMIGHVHETLEKELNLATALQVADKLQALGATVVMTRTKDEKPELAERVTISDNAGADAFVSIHYNSSPKPVSGTLTFYYSDADEKLARYVEARLADGIGLKSNGISFGNYHVLRENDAPSVLAELGFLSNGKDEDIVRTDEYRRKAAEAIAAGLQDYFA